MGTIEKDLTVSQSLNYEKVWIQTPFRTVALGKKLRVAKD